MPQTSHGTLRVPGASLFYEIHGSGPLLLMIAGGGGSCAGFIALANALADTYTCVLYDRRGAARSPLDDPDQEVSIQMQSSDASLLLSHLSHEPAYVFGSSAGALIGLDLVAHSPHLVHTLLAHEPPTEYLLPNAERAQEDYLEIAQRYGAAAALSQLAAHSGMNLQDREPDAQLSFTQEQSAINADAFFKYTFLAVQRYRLDEDALLASPTRIVLCGGSTGRGYVGY